MATYSNTAREVEMPNGDVVVIHNAPTGGENTTSNIKKFKYDDNGHVTESSAADAEDLNLSGYSTPTTGTTAIGTSDDIQTAIGKLDHQSHIDQTNILYSTRTGAQNLIECSNVERLKQINTYPSWTWIGNTYKHNTSGATFTVNGDGSITVNGTFTDQTFFYINDDGKYEDTARFKGLATSRFWGCPEGGSDTTHFLCFHRVSPNYYWSDYGEGCDIGTIETTQKIDVFIVVRGNTTVSNKTYYPSFTLKSIYNQDSSFCPGALPNYDLTRLEAEDRAALAEVVDSGAKNVYQVPTTIDNDAGLTITTNPSTGTITVSGTATKDRYIQISGNLSLYGTYIVQGCPSTGSSSTYYLHLEQSNEIGANDVGDKNYAGSTNTYNSASCKLYIRVVNGVAFGSGVTFTPIVCTKAAFGVSNKFVPYRPNWDLVGTLFPTTYSVPTKDSKITSIDSGGYVRMGNLVNVNIRCTVGTAVPQYGQLFSGLPKPVRGSGLSVGAGVIVCATNHTILMITTEGAVQNFETTDIPTGILELTATYLCQ